MWIYLLRHGVAEEPSAGRPDEERLTEDIIELARQYGRCGYRPVTALLDQSGWQVNHMA